MQSQTSFFCVFHDMKIRQLSICVGFKPVFILRYFNVAHHKQFLSVTVIYITRILYRNLFSFSLHMDFLPFSSVHLSTTHIASWKYWPFGSFALINTKTGADYFNLTPEMPLKTATDIHFNFCPIVKLKRTTS